ncbi:MAG TPA: S9 family peptidase [Vicinamibacterales bacterium]|nr:S9 family peptidase [Vicinamibacterales bacterium]
MAHLRLCPRRLTVLTLALVAVLSLAAAAQERFTPHHVAKLRTVTAVTIAPDGRHAAYVLSVPRVPFQDEDGPAWEELHVAAADGTTRPFVTGQVNVGAIRWTPDGRGIAFLAKRSGDDTRALYIVPFTGGEARRVLKHDADIVAFDIGADGRQVAFIARPAPLKEQQDLARRGFNQEIYEESVRPQQLWITTLQEGSEVKAARAVTLPGHPSNVAWSPDGTRLAVIHAPTPLVDDDLMGKRLWVVDATTGTVSARIENPGKLGQFAWSPDSRHLAFVSAEDVNDPAEGRLMVAAASGGPFEDVLPGYEAHVRSVVWKDGQTIIFTADEGVGTVVGEVRRDGTGRRTIVPNGRLIATAIDRANDGTLALVADTPTHPGELFFLPSGSGEPRRVTDSNPWLKSMRLAKQEVVTFKARDGLELQGILIRPLDERPGQRYPLILTVHGGPEARDANGWRTSYSNPGQVGAAEGFAVFYPNYRGSTGRGVAFSKLGHGEPAGKEFDDLVDAVDHLVQTGLVDRDKVGITGGSYGGYASAWGATYYSDRFAAAVMFVGISNNISKIGTTDIANEEFEVHARKRVWDDWQFFLERSPIYHADKSRTPTLILHGTADPRVHPAQSLELYRHLKLRGKAPVRLVWYPGEGHGNRRAASRLDYNLRLMRWMSHYLKGPGGAPPPWKSTTGCRHR